MKRSFIVAGALALAASGGRAAQGAPPAVVSGRANAERTASAKLHELETILLSRNDNDPRLDLDFNALTPGEKRLFRNKYAEIAREKRNERGTVVYLLGKNLKTPEDWRFFKEVVLEPPCLSLSDCSKRPAPGSDEEATGDEVTLAYPSLVALRQAGAAVEKARTARVSAQGAAKGTEEKAARDLFSAAKRSPTKAVTRLAESLEKKFASPRPRIPNYGRP